MSELPSLGSIINLDSYSSSTWTLNNNVYCFEDIKGETESSILHPWDWTNNIYDQPQIPKTELVCDNDNKEKRVKVVSGRKRTVQLELEEIQKHFHLPSTTAAKELKVGSTVLKKQCREFNIMRWPHRKIKSLKALINNVKVRTFLYMLLFCNF